MVRVVRLADGGVAVGRSLPGRGAWLCAGSPACVAEARKRRAFERALRGPLDAAAVERLASGMAPGPGGAEGGAAVAPLL
jgi:hypothetical protein